MAELVPDDKTIIDGMAGESLKPHDDMVPGQGGVLGRTSDALDVDPRTPPDTPRPQDEAPDSTSATDVVDLIEANRPGDENPTNVNFDKRLGLHRNRRDSEG
jgi:hypothetical protein